MLNPISLARLRRALTLACCCAAAVLAPTSIASAAGPPALAQYGATSTSSSTVKLSGAVDPNGSTTTYQAEYDLSSSIWCSTQGAQGSAASLSPAQVFQQSIMSNISVSLTGLTPGVSYCAKLVATNDSGTVRSFFPVNFTAGAPVVGAPTVTNTGATSADIGDFVYPAGQETSYQAAWDVSSSDWCSSLGSSGSPANTTTPQPLAGTTESETVVASLTGLTAGSSYCVQMIAQNSSATSRSGLTNFVAGAPTATTVQLTVTGAGSIKLIGSVAPAGQSAQYGVAYDLAASSWCASNGSQGNPSNIGPLSALASGLTSQSVTATVSGLTPGTAYCAAIYASNPSASRLGQTMTFTAGLPSAMLYSISPSGASEAVATGFVGGAGQAATFRVEYDLSSSSWCTSYGMTGSPAHSTAAKSIGGVDADSYFVSERLTSLTGGQSYCARVVVTNATGSAASGVQTVVVGLPSVSYLRLNNTSSTSARIDAYVNPMGQQTSWHAEWDLISSSFCSNPDGGGAAHSTADSQISTDLDLAKAVGANITGLTPGAEYCALIKATNASGGSRVGFFGQTRFTAGSPTATVLEVSDGENSAVSLAGRINPGGLPTQYRVDWDTINSEFCASYGTSGSPASSTGMQSLGFADATWHGISAQITSVIGGKTYCFTITTSNSAGTNRSNPFVAKVGLPGVDVDSVAPTGSGSARVDGRVAPAGRSTSYHAAYDVASSGFCNGQSGATPSFETTPVTLPQTDYSYHDVSATLPALTPGEDYCVALVAENSVGSASSGEFGYPFTAGAPTATPLGFYRAAAGSTSAVFRAAINPGGSATSYSVKYDELGSLWCSGYASLESAAFSTPVAGALTGAEDQVLNVTVTGLDPLKQYCAAIVVANSSGSSATVPEQLNDTSPAVQDGSITAKTSTAATLTATVNGRGLATNYRLAWDLASSEWCQAEGELGDPAHLGDLRSLGVADDAEHEVSDEMTGLIPGSSYCAAVIATNATGTTASFPQEFWTPLGANGGGSTGSTGPAPGAGSGGGGSSSGSPGDGAAGGGTNATCFITKRYKSSTTLRKLKLTLTATLSADRKSATLKITARGKGAKPSVTYSLNGAKLSSAQKAPWTARVSASALSRSDAVIAKARSGNRSAKLKIKLATAGC